MNGHEKLEAQIGHTFRDPALLQVALTHPSVTQESRNLKLQHYERLEFLGDAVLNLALAAELFNRFPEADEGILSRARAGMVNDSVLATKSTLLGMGEFLVISKSGQDTGLRQQTSSLANSFEALIAAIYLDAGFEKASEFLRRVFSEELRTIDYRRGSENPKGELQELLQADAEPTPTYETVAATGPAHNRQFECVVLHRGEELARGHGKSKKAAETEAALIALRRLRESQASGSASAEPAA